MDDIRSLAQGLLAQLGQTFLLGGFLPLLVFVAINQYLIFAPEYSAAADTWNLFPGIAEPLLGIFTGELLTTLITPLVLALGLLILNNTIVRFFEGLLPGQKLLLAPLLARQRSIYRRYYGPIDLRRRERREQVSDVLLEGGTPNEEADLALRETLDTLHLAREEQHGDQRLPFAAGRVAPTDFGNAWAVIEEYSDARYGMDGMLFWPYLRTIVMQQNPGLLDIIDGHKLRIDITLNLSLIMGLLLAEGLIFAVLRLGQPAMILVALLAGILAWAFYRAALSYTRSMGSYIAQVYDLYRWKLLDAFGLARPDTLDAEYLVWTWLAAFIRRGEPFYFDQIARKTD